MPKHTEHPAISKRPSFFRHLAAIFYDAILLLAILFFATALILPLNSGEAYRSNQIFFPLYLFFTGFIFFGWFWTHGGQTLGLRCWKIKVTSAANQPITWKKAFIRYITAIFSWSCLGMGFLWVFFNSERLTWHDILSDTQLVHNQRQ